MLINGHCRMDLDQWYAKTRKLIESKSESAPGGCLLWRGGPHDTARYPYGMMSARVPGTPKSQPYRVHRLMYMVSRRTLDIARGLEVSHLCHHARCVQAGHIVLEPSATNHQRSICKTRNQCLDIHSPKCIFSQVCLTFLMLLLTLFKVSQVMVD